MFERRRVFVVSDAAAACGVPLNITRHESKKGYYNISIKLKIGIN
jgi:hypothetical protein